MAEESKILELLVQRQVDFQKALKKAAAKTRNAKLVQLPLPTLKPTVLEKETISQGKEKG